MHDIGLDLFPMAVAVADFFAVGADWQQAAELLDLALGLLQFVDQPGLLQLGGMAFGDVQYGGPAFLPAGTPHRLEAHKTGLEPVSRQEQLTVFAVGTVEGPDQKGAKTDQSASGSSWSKRRRNSWTRVAPASRAPGRLTARMLPSRAKVK